MKKLLIIFMLIFMAAAIMSSCGSKNDDDGNKTNNPPELSINFDDIKDKRWIIIEGSKLENEQFDITSEGIITSFTGE